MDTKILDWFDSKLKEQEQMQNSALLGGAAKDFAGYRELVGVIRGLRVAQGLVEDLRQRLEKQNGE